MPALRYLIIPLLLPAVFATVHAAEVPDDLDVTRSLAQSGAVQLALRRIDALQPRDAAAPSSSGGSFEAPPKGTSFGAPPKGTSFGAPPKGTSFGAPPKGTSFGARWVEWENLRWQLLARLNRNDEVLRRAGALPPALPAAAHAGLHAMAAHAALALGRTVVARDHAGRALWNPGINAGVLRELRLLVIRSYVRDASAKGTAYRTPADDAYRSMLRFGQDYRPLDSTTATIFVDALLDLGMAREAVAWLNLLDERGPAKLRLRLHTGVVTPQDAVAQARAALGRSEDPAWWRILREAADRQNNGALRLAAMEQLLGVAAAGVAEGVDADAGRLWEAYVGHARAAANSHRLLAGDDAGWLEFALRRRATEPAESRAYLAHLARYAHDPKVRQDAQIRLAADFSESKLPRTGLRLFGIWPADAGVLTAPTRHTLGALAETIGDHPRALQYWQDLSAPDNMPAAVWNLRLSALALRAGRADVAAGLARSLAMEQSAISAAQLPEWITLAQQFTDHGLHDAAQTLFERMLPHADAVQARRILSGIARNHEARDQPLRAADFYLRSALLAPVTDAGVTQARLLAGLSLARAGLREDAKAQFEWLLKNAGDPAQIAVARRELGF